MNYADIVMSIANFIQNALIAHGYYILLILSVLEGLPLIGLVFPGHIAIFASGFLVSAGVFRLELVLLIAIVGSLVGDIIGFYIGRKYGNSFLAKIRPYIFLEERHIAKTKEVIESHTGKSVILGRMHPITRVLMPFLAGSSRTPSARFWTFNVIGVLIWVLLSVLVGYIFGEGYRSASKYFGGAVLFAVVLVLLMIWAYRFVNKRFHIFAKYDLFTLIVSVSSLLILAFMIRDALAATSFLAMLDIRVNDIAAHMPSYIGSAGMIVSNIGGVIVTMTLGAIIAVYCAFKGRYRFAATAVFATVSTAFFVVMLKEFFGRVRPDSLLNILTDPSFPSGHSALAASLFFVIIYIFAARIKSVTNREVVITLCIIVVGLIGISRVVVGAHWFSDVIAGWSLGLFLASASALLVGYVSSIFVRRSYVR